MRALFALAMIGIGSAGSAGCSKLLGITDPTVAPVTGDGGPIDTMVDSSIDAPPPCTTPTSFGAEIVLDTGEPALALAIGDFDAGGVDDIAIATGDDVSIFHGDGAGTFGGDGVKIKVPTPASDLILDDFDADGDDDLVMWTTGGTSVVLRRQNRLLNPPFEAAQPLTGPFTGVQHVLPGQLDGDLRADVLVQDSTGSRVYTSNLGTPGTFGRDSALVGTGADELLAIRQLDQAQRADAVFVTAAGDVRVSLQTSSFGALSTVATAVTGRGVALGNFDNDSFLDLVVATTTGLVLYRQVPAQPGTFTLTGTISPLTGTTLAVGDLNGDGLDDIVVPSGFVLQCAPLASGGAGTFTQFEAVNVAGPLLLRDLTGDGKVDLLRLDGNALRVRIQ
ncbi:MAG: VCBS repeat-containing protein [Myxococcota bacterium]|nr:VCBS repeat-containing protein [Myxococcota bacterium]